MPLIAATHLLLLLAPLGCRRFVLLVIVLKEFRIDIEHGVGPFELGKFDAHVVEGHHGLGLEVALRDLCDFLVPWGEVREDCAPNSAFLADLNSLANCGMLFPFSILCKRVLKSRLMDEQGHPLAVVQYVFARVGISRVENAAEAV